MSVAAPVARNPSTGADGAGSPPAMDVAATSAGSSSTRRSAAVLAPFRNSDFAREALGLLTSTLAAMSSQGGDNSSSSGGGGGRDGDSGSSTPVPLPWLKLERMLHHCPVLPQLPPTDEEETSKGGGAGAGGAGGASPSLPHLLERPSLSMSPRTGEAVLAVLDLQIAVGEAAHTGRVLPYLLAVLRHIPVVEMPNEPAHEIKSFQTRFISKLVAVAGRVPSCADAIFKATIELVAQLSNFVADSIATIASPAKGSADAGKGSGTATGLICCARVYLPLVAVLHALAECTNVWTLSLLQRMFAALAPARSPTALLGLDSVAAQLVASASNTAERMSVANIGVLLRFELVNVLSAICGDIARECEIPLDQEPALFEAMHDFATEQYTSCVSTLFADDSDDEDEDGEDGKSAAPGASPSAASSYEQLAEAIVLCARTASDTAAGQRVLQNVQEHFFDESEADPLTKPFFAAAFRALPCLTRRLPTLTASALQMCRDFLLKPSPILVTLLTADKDPGSQAQVFLKEMVAMAVDCMVGILDSRPTECTNFISSLATTLVLAGKAPPAALGTTPTGSQSHVAGSGAGAATVPTATATTTTTSAGSPDTLAVPSADPASPSSPTPTPSSDMVPAFILRSVVQLLSSLAVANSSNADIVHLVLSMLNQRLFFPPSQLDVNIVQRLAILAYKAPETAYKVVIDLLTQICWRVLHQRVSGTGASDGSEFAQWTEKYQYLTKSSTVTKALQTVAKNLPPGSPLAADLLERMLMVFVRIVSESQQQGLAAWRGHTVALGPLLPIMGTLARLLPPMDPRSNPNARLLHPYRAFWFYAVLVQLVGRNSSKWSEEWRRALDDLAVHSPLLMDPHGDVQMPEIRAFALALKDKFSAKDLAMLHTLLAEIVVPNHPSLNNDAHRVDVVQCIYLLAVYHLERKRVQQQHSFRFLFRYLQDSSMSDRQAQLMGAICDELLTVYLDVMTKAEATPAREAELEELAVFLLVKFNHHMPLVKSAADQYLSLLTARFPHLLWSGRVLPDMLDLVEKLSQTLEAREETGMNETVELPHPPFSVTVPDNLTVRRRIVTDFAAHCGEILQQGLAYHPKKTSFILQKYMSRVGQTHFARPHAGVAIVLEALTSRGRRAAAEGDQPSILSHHEVLHVLGPALTMRSRHEGELEGLRFLTDAVEDVSLEDVARGLEQRLLGMADVLVEHGSREVDAQPGGARLDSEVLVPAFMTQVQAPLPTAAASATSPTSPSSSTLSMPLSKALRVFATLAMKLSALLAGGTSIDSKLIDALVWAPMRVFNVEAMRTAIFCWRWVLSSRRDVELELLCQVRSAWIWSMEQSLGLFSQHHGHSQSREQISGDAASRLVPNVEPHELLIEFLDTRFKGTALRSREQSTIYNLIATYSLEDGNRLCRHTAAVKARFDLFQFAATVMEKLTRNTIFGLPGTNQIVLRERLYDSVLASFAQPPKWPATSNVRRTIEAMVAFWETMMRDKTACKDIDAQIKTENMRLTSDARHRASQGADFTRRLHLALLLVRHEILRYCAWYNPMVQTSLMVDREDVVRKCTKPTPAPSDHTWREYIRLAWSVHPHLAIFICFRFGNTESLRSIVSRFVVLAPDAVMDLPEALSFLITPANVERNIPELTNVLSWAPVAPITALNLLRDFPGHPIISQYAIRVLHNFPPDMILFAIPQLVQVLRYDTRGYVAKYILDAAHRSQLLTHQLIWNMKTNMDEDGKIEDPVLAPIIKKLSKLMVDGLDERERAFYEREFDFFGQITAVSGLIKDKPLGPERQVACLDELAKVQLQPGCYLPSNPEAIVLDIVYKSARPMQSAARAPYLATFKVQPCGLEVLEKCGEDGTTAELEARKEEIGEPRLQSCIFKVGDDVRQDMLALQVISLFDQIFKAIDLELFLFPYRVVATSPGCGVIECVPNAKSRQELGRQTAATLYEYFIKLYGDESTLAFQQARQNFIKSMAAYSVVGFLLQIKDRHNGNIMLNDQGHIIHIDFGFMFESSPGGNIGFEPDIKLTMEMVQIMGGDQNAPPFRWFMELCERAYLAARPYQEQIISLVALMLDTGLPCFRTDKILDSLRMRFQPGRSEAEAAQYLRSRVDKSYLNFRTNAYDYIQYVQNRIEY